jgi:hypothetical protein
MARFVTSSAKKQHASTICHRRPLLMSSESVERRLRILFPSADEAIVQDAVRRWYVPFFFIRNIVYYM